MNPSAGPATTVHDSSSTPPSARPPIDEIVTLACRAPSIYNTQPWLWRLHDHTLELIADYSRQVAHADPDGRDLLLSCGAALHHLQVAAAVRGWSVRVRRMPDPSNPHRLATVQLTPARPSPEASALLGAITVRQTDRRRFTSWPVPEDRLNGLAVTGSHWGAQVLPVTQDSVRDRLDRLTLRADGIQRDDPGYRAELSAWTRQGRDGVRWDGVPSATSAVTVIDRLSRRFPDGMLDDPVLEPEPGEHAMLLVCTSSDDTVARLRAGEAMSAVWLRATQDRLGVVPLSQALEVDETRREIQTQVLGDLACPQVLLRIGWPALTRAGLPATGRRPLDDVLVRD